jgi:predicted nucleic acid-binding protein
MIVVSDTSCISNLLTIGEVHLLRDLFNEVIVPPAVETELRRFHPTLPAFVRSQVPQKRGKVAELAREIDLGEAEAICLALELRADRLLIDEKLGRRVATREGLAVIGVVGLLITAKQRGLINSVKSALMALESKAGFYLREDLKRRALDAVNER